MVRTKKRTLTAIAAAALLCMLAALVCFVIPAGKTAYAAETSEGPVKSGDTYYATLQAAIDADATTIELIDDIEGQGIAIKKNTTIVPNGHKIEGDLTIKNSIGTVKTLTVGKEDVDDTLTITGELITEKERANVNLTVYADLTVQGSVNIEHSGRIKLYSGSYQDIKVGQTNAAAKGMLYTYGGTYNGTISLNESSKLYIYGNTSELKFEKSEFVSGGSVSFQAAGAKFKDSTYVEELMASSGYEFGEAQTEGYWVVQTQKIFTVEVDGQEKIFNNLDDAVEAAANSQDAVIKLWVDHESNLNGIDETVTIDLNGYTLKQQNTLKVGSYSTMNDNITVTLKNGTIALGDGRSASTLLLSYYNATLSLEDVKVDASACSVAAIAVGSNAEGSNNFTDRGGHVVLENCEVIGTQYGIGVYGVAEGGEEKAWTTVQVTGGSITANTFAIANSGNFVGTEIVVKDAKLTATGEDSTGIYHPGVGTLTVEDCAISGGSGIEMRAGTLKVSGDKSTIAATAAVFSEASEASGSTMLGAAVAVSQHVTEKPVSVTIEGGTLKGVKAVYEKDLQGGAVDNITLSLTGGTFEGEVESQNVTGFVSGGSFTNTVADELLAADSLMVFENGQYSVLESAAAENIVIAVGKVGYTSEEDAQKAGVVVKIDKDGAPAEGYLSLADAVAAVPTDNIQRTIVFLGGKGTKVSAPGVRVFDRQNIVIDFNQITFDVTDTVGSPNTETNGFQLNKGATVVMRNGTLTSKTAKILIQQYCKLTVEDMKLDMSACPQVQYVISNNHGTTRITGDTTIVAASGKVAFDVYYGLSTAYAEGVTVVFDENFTGSVAGKVEYGAGSAQTDGWTEKANLQIENGTFDITFSVSVVKETEASVSISGGSFTNVPTAEYIADASALYTDGTKYAVAAEGSAPSGMEKVIFTDSKGKGYASLAAAAGVETLYLYLDLDTMTVNANEEAVIDLNGKTLGNVVNNGTLTIKGMSTVAAVENNGTLTTNGGYYGSLTGDGTVNYLGGYFKTEVSAPEGYTCVDLSVEGASFDEDYNSEYPYAVYRTGEVTIEDSEWTLSESFSALAYEGAQFTYSYAEAEDGTFKGGLPTAAGVWYIKATLTTSRVFADENGNKVCYPAETVFEVTVKARPSVPALVIEGEYCVGTALSEIALPAAENGTWAWKDAALTVGDTAGTANVIAVFTPTDTTYGKVEMEVSVIVVAHTEVTVPGYAATCNATGLTDGAKCSVCGKTLEEQTVISSLGHDLIYHLAKDPTCTKPGWAAYESCTRCDYSTYVEIPAAHTPGEAVRENEKAPTCTATGSYDEVVCCSVCGEELSRKTVTVEAAGHQWGAWETTKAPTCTAEGEETRTCTVCGETETRTAEKAAHTPVTVEGKDATCTEEGLSDGEKCSVCGKTLKEQETVPALGHDFGDWTEDKDAGVETRTCSRCGATETRALPEKTFPVWGIVLICVGGVIVVGGAAAAILIVKKKRA